jgi:AraC-like DNA-binding protein
MYVNSGYLYHSRIDFKDYTRPLIVGSCGTYRLIKRKALPTHRPKGRVDYQLLYIATGQAHFFFNGKEEIVSAGNIVLYFPREEQKYTYYADEHPEVFWVHFTGYDVKNILKYYKFNSERHVYHTGTVPEFRWLFTRMIQEMQMCRPLYEEMLASLLNDLMLLINRQNQYTQPIINTVQSEMEQAVSYFNEHYNEDISVNDYAKAHHISTNHFIRNFKQYVGMTPMQYIVSIRMTNAQALLETADYSIKEIAAIVGYNDALYFGQVFKREVGMPPSKYRIEQHTSEE